MTKVNDQGSTNDHSHEQGFDYGIKEAARILQISVSTLRRKIKNAEIKAFKRHGKHGDTLYIRKEELGNLIQEPYPLNRVSNHSQGTLSIDQGSPLKAEIEARIYKEELERERKQRETLEEELKNKIEFIGALQERLSQERKLLTDRAQSLIEKEARAKELESRLQEEETRRGELSAREEEYQSRLEAEETKRLDLETRTQEDIRQKEEALRQAEEEKSRAREEAEKFLQTLQQEQDIRRKLEAELLDARLPWWKKIFKNK